MSVDTAFQLLVDANPVPDTQALRELRPEEMAFLTDVQQRGQVMKTEEAPATATPSSVRRSPLVAAAIAILVGAVGLIVIQAVQGDDVAAPETPLELAEAYFEAFTALDAEATQELLAPDAEFFNYHVDQITSPDQLTLVYDWYRASEWRFTLDACRMHETDLNLVICEYSHRNAWMAAARPAGIQLFEVQDGLINRIEFTSIAFPEWEEFKEFVATQSVDDFYSIVGLDSGPEVTAESVRLFERYTDEYVAQLEG